MPSDSGAAWSPPAHPAHPPPSGERRNSNSSDGSAGSGFSKPTGCESADYLLLRGKAPGAKPAANPLQFVKVGPCELYRSAQEQLSRAEKVKQNKELKKEELEDWQSNLDNWKSCRRKRVEHIIERCVEVRRLENEPAPGARSKSKTFNEMLEERAGKRRRCPLALYPEEETTDLSDLGIGTSSTKSSLSEDCDTHSLASDGIDLDKNHSDVDNLSNCGSGNRKLGSSANEYDTCTTTTISSPEPEEYTYEGAIEGYKSRMNSDYKNYAFNKEKTPDKVSNGDLNRIRTTVSNKIEERVTSLQNKPELKPNQKKDLPKVDILKRREQFEKEGSLDPKPKLPEISNKMSIKERLSSLEKFTGEQNKSTNDLSKPIPVEVVPLKERLSSLEKLKSSTETEKTKLRQTNGDFNNTKSVRERLSSLKSQTSEEDVKIVKTEVKEVSMSIKERLSNLDAAKNKDIQKQIDLNSDTKEEESKDQSLKTSLSGLENQMQNFCRSLDSLDINGTSSPNSFERVQSFEELESCNEARNITSPSDIETEDSGIQSGRSNDEANLEPAVERSQYTSKDALVASAEPTNDVVEENEDQDASKADTDSASNYQQAVSHQDDLSCADDVTEIQLDNDEDTLKSLDPHDTSVIDALELAFQEIDCDHKPEMSNKMQKTTESNKCKKEITSPNARKNAKEPAKEVAEDSKVKILEAINKTNGEIKKPSRDYENVEMLFENGGAESVDAGVFPLELPRKLLEPPKEKPPPPPVEDCVEDDVPLGNGNFKSTNSTRRIKKEIRNKRTSFLGLEGQEEDYLEVSLAPRPDITSFLQEETKIERLLYKKTLAHSARELTESRDSGVDLDKSPADNKSSPDTSTPHSRQNSEPFTQVMVTSDEEEASKRSREVSRFGETLTTKLEQMQQSPPDLRSQQNKIDSLDKTLQQQQEVLRFERELLELEQEELRRQRDNLLLRESQTRRLQRSVHDVRADRAPRDHRHSMPNLLAGRDLEAAAREGGARRGAEGGAWRGAEGGARQQSARPAPLAPKPRLRDERERELMMRSSRVPSAADYVNIEKPRPKPIINGVIPTANGQYHPMTRHTLQALSAAPTPKLMSGAEWLQARGRKQVAPHYHYNNHWLIQEAEQRRLDEQRSAPRPHPHRDLSHAHQHNLHPHASETARGRERDGEAVLSVSGRRKCSHCGLELGRGAAMIIESLSLCYHVQCFSCVVCGARLGDGRAGADVRVRARRLHCHHCYSSDDGTKLSCV